MCGVSVGRLANACYLAARSGKESCIKSVFSFVDKTHVVNNFFIFFTATSSPVCRLTAFTTDP